MPRPKKLPALTPFTAAGFGILSRYTVMPWEDEREYQTLYQALIAAHDPVGPTEVHLVEELAGVMWRKQRHRQAEAALYRKEMEGLSSGNDYQQKKIIRSALVGKAPSYIAQQVGAGGTALTVAIGGQGAELVAQEQAAKTIQRAHRVVEQINNGAKYREALALLPENLRDEYETEYLNETLTYTEGGEDIDFTYEEKPADLAHYLTHEAIPRLEETALLQTYADDIAEQVKGEAVHAGKLEALGKYELALDRKLERTLAVLLKMQEIRKGGTWKPAQAAE